jgi:hypothetical protein
MVLEKTHREHGVEDEAEEVWEGCVGHTV